jgi:hypothetical protein
MTHKHSCDCSECRRIWGDPRERLRRFLRRLDQGDFRACSGEDPLTFKRGEKTVVVCRTG